MVLLHEKTFQRPEVAELSPPNVTFPFIPTTALVIPSCLSTYFNNSPCLSLIRMVVALGHLNNLQMVLPATLTAAQHTEHYPFDSVIAPHELG